MELREQEKLLLEGIRCALTGNSVCWTDISEELWVSLFELACRHKVLPLIYEAVRSCPAAIHSAAVLNYKKQVMLQVMQQTQMSRGALDVYAQLQDYGIRPLILKGAVCRRLYPSGDLRISGDEDFYVTNGELEACCAALLEMGFVPSDDKHESWTQPDSPVYIELHTSLFPSEQIFGTSLEGLFSNYQERREEYEAELGRRVCSFDPHVLFLYLILHAYKHFLFSGFGIRQICDIGLWAKQYADRIDWELLYRECESVRAVGFAAALFRIARQVLGISFPLPEVWNSFIIDEGPLLRDVLDAGIYGSASSSRLHSAAALGQAGSSPVRVLFPEREYMEERYPACKDKPYLLPVMWAKRLGAYCFGVFKGEQNPLEAVGIARERKNLLKKYQIL